MTIIEMAVLLCSLLCVLRGGVILSFRKPAKATFIYDGYRKYMRERSAAIFHKELAPVPLRIEDLILYTTQDGREVRATVTRWSRPLSSPFIV